MSKLTYLSYTGFCDKDIGKAIQMKIKWRTRFWYLVQRFLLRRKVDPPGLYIVTAVKGCQMAEIEPAFICYSCKRIVPWNFGCADDLPHVCDDCWGEAHCPICKAEPGKSCDAGLHG